jgi:hypothetical protein
MSHSPFLMAVYTVPFIVPERRARDHKNSSFSVLCGTSNSSTHLSAFAGACANSGVVHCVSILCHACLKTIASVTRY